MRRTTRTTEKIQKAAFDCCYCAPNQCYCYFVGLSVDLVATTKFEWTMIINTFSWSVILQTLHSASFDFQNAYNSWSIKCVFPSPFWHWIWLTLDPGDIDIDLNTGWQRPRIIQYGRRHSRLLLASDLISMHTRDLMQLCCWRWINDVLALMFNLMLDWTLFSWETVCSETSGLNPQSHVCINSVIYRVCMLQQLLIYIMVKLLMYIMVTSQQCPLLQTYICKSPLSVV